MGINIASVPNSIRKPGAYIDFDISAASRGLPANKQKMLVIAQRLAAGTVAQAVPTQVFSDEEAASYFGRGSQCHLMARAAFRANPYCDLTICALDDNGAGVAATGTVTLTGPATGAGVLSLFVGAVKADVAIATGDTATAIAAALKAELDKLPNLPVTATVNLGVVTLTAKNKGTCGNSIPVGYQLTNAGGVTVAVVAMAGGAADPSLSPALTAVFPSRFHLLAIPYQGSTEVTAVRTHLDSVSGPIERRGGNCVVALTGSLGSATTLASALNSGRVWPVYMRYAATQRQALPWEIAARVAADVAYYEDPAYNFDYFDLPEIPPPDISARLTRAEQETLLWSGVTPLQVGPGEMVQIVRLITSYTLNGAGAPDPALLDASRIRILDYFRDAVSNRILLRFKAAKLTAKTPARVKTEILDISYRTEAAEIIGNVDKWKNQLVVEKDPNIAGRINANVPAEAIDGFHVFAAVIALVA